MTIAARCPSCQTAFKIPDTLLEKNQGRVRCSKCKHIFLAKDHELKIKSKATEQTKTENSSLNTDLNNVNLTTNSYTENSINTNTLNASINTEQNNDKSLNKIIISNQNQANSNLVIKNNESEPEHAPIDIGQSFESLLKASIENQKKVKESLKPESSTISAKNISKKRKPKQVDVGMNISSTALPEPEFTSSQATNATPIINQSILFNDKKESEFTLLTPNQQSSAFSNFIDKVANFLTFSNKKSSKHGLLTHSLKEWQIEQKQKRFWLKAVWLIAFVVLLQIIYWQRNTLNNKFPSLTPMFASVCKVTGCQLAPLKLDNNPVVSYSDMQRDLSLFSNQYVLNLALKNKESVNVAMPYLEISLFDLNEQLVMRRIFNPKEFLKIADWQRIEAKGITSQEELPVKIRFQTQKAINSFKIRVFYQ